MVDDLLPQDIILLWNLKAKQLYDCVTFAISLKLPHISVDNNLHIFKPKYRVFQPTKYIIIWYIWYRVLPRTVRVRYRTVIFCKNAHKWKPTVCRHGFKWNVWYELLCGCIVYYLHFCVTSNIVWLPQCNHTIRLYKLHHSNTCDILSGRRYRIQIFTKTRC